MSQLAMTFDARQVVPGAMTNDLKVVRVRKADVLPLLAAHHYLGARVADPMECFGWDERGTLRAAVVYASPINRYFGSGAVELARLVRDATLATPLSMFVAATLRWLGRHIRPAYVLSYADSGQGHHGGIYQALSFLYVRESAGHSSWVHSGTGERCSARAFDQRSPENRAGWVRAAGTKKYLYVRPVREGRAALLSRFGWEPMPYPKPAREEEGA